MEDGREVAQRDRQTFISTFPPWVCASSVMWLPRFDASQRFALCSLDSSICVFDSAEH
jgi:hypothetical protein